VNEKNLTPFSERSVSEAREAGSKGGKASGETRRRKKDMKQKMKALLELPAAANDREQREALGISPDDMDNEMVLVMSMFLSAAQGDTKAFDRVIQILGKDIAHEELALKKRELKLKEKASSEGDSAALSKLDEVLGKIEGGF
jgi:thioredoxin-like negative regulator of GroEL